MQRTRSLGVRWAAGLVSVMAGCLPPAAPVQFPGDESPDALTLALEQLDLSPNVVDPAARCDHQPPAYPTGEPACQPPRMLALGEPLLRDLRRERIDLHLRPPGHYREAVQTLEQAIGRSRPGGQARRSILRWLAVAYDRWRAAQHAYQAALRGRRAALASPCLVHYYGLLVGEAPNAGDLRYLLALELELVGAHQQAALYYDALAGSSGVGAAAAHAALGDAAFRESFCDAEPGAKRRLHAAHRHYLVAAYTPAPDGSPFAGYARLRLAQLLRQRGSLGPALRQLELAEADFGGFSPATQRYLGPRREHLRDIGRGLLRGVIGQSLQDGSLRLLLAFEPPGSTACDTLEELSSELLEQPPPGDGVDHVALAANRGEREALLSELLGQHCSWRSDGNSCVATAGCSVPSPPASPTEPAR